MKIAAQSLSSPSALELFCQDEWPKIAASLCAGLVEVRPKRPASLTASTDGSARCCHGRGWFRGIFVHFTNVEFLFCFVFCCLCVPNNSDFFLSFKALLVYSWWKVKQPERSSLHLEAVKLSNVFALNMQAGRDKLKWCGLVMANVVQQKSDSSNVFPVLMPHKYILDQAGGKRNIFNHVRHAHFSFLRASEESDCESELSPAFLLSMLSTQLTRKIIPVYAVTLKLPVFPEVFHYPQPNLRLHPSRCFSMYIRRMRICEQTFDYRHENTLGLCADKDWWLKIVRLFFMSPSAPLRLKRVVMVPK